MFLLSSLPFLTSLFRCELDVGVHVSPLRLQLAAPSLQVLFAVRHALAEAARESRTDARESAIEAQSQFSDHR